MSTRRILYVGQLWEGGTCGERMKILAALGNDVVPFDTSSYTRPKNRFVNWLAHHANMGSPISRLNEELARFVNEQASGVSHIWVDKGRWIKPETLRLIKRITSAQIIHFTLDPQLVHHKSRFFKSAIPLYDNLITTKHYEAEEYRRLGARHLMVVPQGFDQRFFPRSLSSSDREQYGADVTFVGHYESHYARILRAVSTLGVSLKIWGPGWVSYSQRNDWAFPHVRGDGIWGDAYPTALCCAKVGLGLLSKITPDTSTTRSFEIPACQSLLLAERTEEHRQLFTEGVEADYFSSERELMVKIERYLAKDCDRQSVAEAGRRRCIYGGYSSREIVRTILATIDARAAAA